MYVCVSELRPGEVDVDHSLLLIASTQQCYIKQPQGFLPPSNTHSLHRLSNKISKNNTEQEHSIQFCSGWNSHYYEKFIHSFISGMHH